MGMMGCAGWMVEELLGSHLGRWRRTVQVEGRTPGLGFVSGGERRLRSAAASGA